MIVELADRLLKLQRRNARARIGDLLLDLLFIQLRQLRVFCTLHLVSLHLMVYASTWSGRMTSFVLIGSLWPARRNASSATVCGTPPISNMMRPGRMTATQNSGEPLPEPIRVSAGFFVTGLSGKIRIQILPPRLTERVIARRAASIWRLVIHAGSWVARP